MGVEYIGSISAYVHRWTCDQCGRHVRQITFGPKSTRVPRDWHRVNGRALCAWCGVNAASTDAITTNGGSNG